MAHSSSTKQARIGGCLEARQARGSLFYRKSMAGRDGGTPDLDDDFRTNQCTNSNSAAARHRPNTHRTDAGEGLRTLGPRVPSRPGCTVSGSSSDVDASGQRFPATNRRSGPMDHRQSGGRAKSRLLGGRPPAVGFLGAGADALSRRHRDACRSSRLDRDIGHRIFVAGGRRRQRDPAAARKG